MRILKKSLLITLGFLLINYPFIWARISYYIGIERLDKLGIYLASHILVIGIVILFSFTRMRLRIPLLLLFLAGSLPYLINSLAVGTELNYEEFRLLLDARANISDAAQSYIGPLIIAILRHLPLIFFFLLYPDLTLSWRGSFMAILLYLLGLTAILHFIFSKDGRGTSGRASYLVPVAHSVTFIYLNYLKDDEASFTYIPRKIPTAEDLTTPKAKNIIIVMDESIRWDMIDLNHETISHPSTTPSLLDFSKETLFNFGPTLAFSNCSNSSNFAIRKSPRLGKEASDLFIDKSTIWELALQAGFKPYLFDAQHNGKGHNFYTAQELQEVENIRASDITQDGEIFTLIEEAMSEDDSPKFIYIGLKGAHFPYVNYGFKEYFQPAMKNTNLHDATPEEALNSYKNLVRANTDGFFSALKHFLNQHPDTLLIYTADHGQDLSNPKGKKTHCDLRNPSIDEGVVPMLLFNPQAFHSPFLTQFTENRGLPSQHFIPPLLLHFLGYSEEAIAHYTEYSAILNREDSVGFIYQSPLPHFRNSAKRVEITQSAFEYYIHNGELPTGFKLTEEESD